MTEDSKSAVGANEPPTLVDRRLLELLVCPMSKGELVYDATRQELVSRAARIAYPIRDGVPIMLVEEARPVDDNDPVFRRPAASSS